MRVKAILVITLILSVLMIPGIQADDITPFKDNFFEDLKNIYPFGQWLLMLLPELNVTIGELTVTGPLNAQIINVVNVTVQNVTVIGNVTSTWGVFDYILLGGTNINNVFLNLSGENANQNIIVSPFNFTAGNIFATTFSASSTYTFTSNTDTLMRISGAGGENINFDVEGTNVLDLFDDIIEVRVDIDMNGNKITDNSGTVSFDDDFINVGNGAVGGPAYSFTTDSTTGMYFTTGGPGGNTINFASAGSRKLALTSGAADIAQFFQDISMQSNDISDVNDLFVNDDVEIGDDLTVSGNLISNLDATGFNGTFDNIFANNLIIDTNMIYTTSVNNFVGFGTTNPIAPIDIHATVTSIYQTRHSNTAGQGAGIVQRRARGTAEGSEVVVQDGDHLGASPSFQGWNDNGAGGYDSAARVSAFVDGEPASGSDQSDMPGRWSVFTSSDGSATPTLRMSVRSTGIIESFFGIQIDTDNAGLEWGQGQDVLCIFNGTDMVCNAQVGSPNYFFEGFPLIYTDGSLNVANQLTAGNGTAQVVNNRSGLFLEGEARAKRELIFKATNAVKGASAPADAFRDVGESGGVKDPVISFSKTIQQDIYGSFHPASDMDESENVSFHLMWIPGDSWTSGAYNWSLEYIIKAEDASMGANAANVSYGNTTIITELITPSNNEYYIETEFTTTINISRQQVLIAHFYRDVDDDADDVGEVRFFEVEYVVNSMGEEL